MPSGTEESIAPPTPRRGRSQRSRRPPAIRNYLLVAFVLLVLLPAVVIAAATAIAGFVQGRQQVIAQLELVATLKEGALTDMVERLHRDLNGALAGQDVLLYAQTLLQPGFTPSASDYSAMEGRLKSYTGADRSFEQLALLDRQGQVIVSTDRAQRDALYADAPFFQGGLQGPFLSPPYYDQSTGWVALIVATPVADKDGQLLGVFAGYAHPTALADIMLEQIALGQSGEAYLADRHGVLLTPARSGEVGTTLSQPGIAPGEGRQAGLYRNSRGEAVLGVYRWLPGLQVTLRVEQGQWEALAPLYLVLGIEAGVTLLLVAAAVAFSLLVTHRIATPLSQLTQAAGAVAQGDIERSISARGFVEIDTLAAALNSMTQQLRELIGNLEQRVKERTQELDEALHRLQAESTARENLLRTIRHMSSPVIPVIEGALVMPLVGILDSERAGQVMEDLLNAAERQRARVVILDITGLAVVDTAVANTLLQTAQAIQLLGAQTLLVGVTPEVAATLVHLGVDLHDLHAAATLQEGLRQAARLLRQEGGTLGLREP